MSDRPVPPLINIETDREQFVRSGALELLRKLVPDTPAKWGIMSPQHMVEHLIYILDNSITDRDIPLLIPEEKLPRYMEFLRSSYGFVRNFKFPLIPEDEPVPLQFESLADALASLDSKVKELFDFMDRPDFSHTKHPFYGNLNREDTIMFHFKHFTHHLAQFGLVN